MKVQLDAVQIIRGMIANKAYELYEQRGKFPGLQQEDWYLAEQKIFTEFLELARPKKETQSKSSTKNTGDPESVKTKSTRAKLPKQTLNKPRINAGRF